MPNSEFLSDTLLKRAQQDQVIIERRLRKAQEALAPYENDVDEFVREKGLHIIKWRMNYPAWQIGRTQKNDDLDKIQWTIQFGYNERRKKLGLAALAWIDTEYDVPDGRVHERKLSDSSEKHLIANWKKGDTVNIKELLEQAYQRATSYTEQDLTKVSASITGKDGFTRPYNPQLPVS